MTTSSVLTEEQMTLVKPDEGVMIDRGDATEAPRDMDQLRQELAPVNQLDPGTKYVEEGSATFVDADSDMPTGPTGIGESLGNIELVRVVGGQQEIPRYTHGFSYDLEDGEVDDSFLQDARDGILELFDLQADVAFFQGLEDEAGNQVFPGVFEWLQNNMPSENVIDCSQYDLSAGDLQGVPANIVSQVAYGKASGVYVDNTWDVAVAKHDVWADWNQLGTFDGATIQSQWELMQADDNEADVGITRRMLLPDTMGLPSAPGQDANFQFEIDFPSRENASYSSPLDDPKDDCMFLIPNHGGDFYELYEQGSPDVRGPLEKEGWKERFEYKWRGGAVYGQNGHKTDTDVARDVIKLENVTALFA